MEAYIKLIEPLIIKMVAISYKITVDIPLSDEDKLQIENIKKCATLFNELNKGRGNILIEQNEENKNISGEDSNLISDSNSNLHSDSNSNLNVDPDFDFSLFVDDNKSIINFQPESTNTKEDKTENEISYDTDPELIEICKSNKIKFDEYTKQDFIKLQNIQDSFWRTTDVS